MARSGPSASPRWRASRCDGLGAEGASTHRSRHPKHAAATALPVETWIPACAGMTVRRRALPYTRSACAPLPLVVPRSTFVPRYPSSFRSPTLRRSREGGSPFLASARKAVMETWIPAFAGMTSTRGRGAALNTRRSREGGNPCRVTEPKSARTGDACPAEPDHSARHACRTRARHPVRSSPCRH